MDAAAHNNDMPIYQCITVDQTALEFIALSPTQLTHDACTCIEYMAYPLEGVLGP